MNVSQCEGIEVVSGGRLNWKEREEGGERGVYAFILSDETV